MAQRSLWLALWSTLARWLRAWTGFVDRQAQRAERRVLKAQRRKELDILVGVDGAPVDAAVAVETPGGPPAHWVERVAHGGPPEHWLEHIRERAPELLDGDHLAAQPLRAEPPAVEKAPLSAPARPVSDEYRPARAATPQRRARPSPLHLIPRLQPAAEEAARAATKAATEAAPAEPASRGRREERKPATVIRLQPQPTAGLTPPREIPVRERQDEPPTPTEASAAVRSLRPARPGEERATQQPRPQSRPRRRLLDRLRRPAAQPATEAPFPHLEAETPARTAPPVVSPRVASRRSRGSQPGPAERVPRRGRVDEQAQQARSIAFDAGRPPAALAPSIRSAPTPVPTREPRPGAEESQMKTLLVKPQPADDGQRAYRPQDKERWPTLPDEEPLAAEASATEDWASWQRDWQRLQRLDQEQRGQLWSESPF